MKCPSCGAKNPDAAVECGACGVVFTKWRELKEKERREGEAALARMSAGEPAPAARNPWIGRGLAIAFVVAWLSALATYFLLWSGRPGPSGR